MKIHFYTNVRLPRRKATFILVFILQLVACSLWGQVMQKKALTVADYNKWGLLRLDKMSPNGEWISYNMLYHNNPDTLFIKNHKSSKTYSFPSAAKGSFINADWFVCQSAKGLHMLELKTGQQKDIAKATRYVYAAAVKRLLVLITEKDNTTLFINKPDGTIEKSISGVKEFLLDPTSQNVLYTASTGNQNSIALLELSRHNQQTILHSGFTLYSNLVWHKKGKALAFTQKYPGNDNVDNALFYYNLSNKKLYPFHSNPAQSQFGDSLYIPTSSYELKISDDTKKIFFTVHRKAETDSAKNSNVQIWNGNAKWIYPMEEKQKPFKGIYFSEWKPFEDLYQQISNDTLSEFMLTGDLRYALLSNPQQYEPQYTYDGPRDYYLVDLATGKRNLFLKKQSGHFLHTIPSPTGKYIAYFREKNWWIFDLDKKTHTNITKNIGQPFFNNDQEYPQNIDSYFNLGWTPQDKEMLMCDAYDIWAVSPNGESPRRLTQGRETQTEFRLAGYFDKPISKINYNGDLHETVNLDQGLLLESTSKEGYFGYYKWYPKSNKTIAFSKSTRLHQLIESEVGNNFAYTEQRYDLSPRLMIKTLNEKTTKIVFQSNPQQQEFHWGKSELIQYKNSKGKILEGVLYYPAQYDKLKKYPMIVYIYEKLAANLHNRYINPSQFTGDGLFNISTFTTQGYFVLAPDITYEIGNPGISATDCVVSATKEIIAKELVLPNKIGLIGHSFGAYEVDFIITQTNLFAAAVAGSAATDLTSFYLTVGWNTGRPDIWRFEGHQWRMGKSLFEDRESYDRNSPIVHAKNITTPLLSWSGDEDKQVNWSQSIEFYLALRRLKKQHIMLLYPKERHTLTKKENKKDLSIRLHEWFDFHLKDTSPAIWIKTGLK